MNNPICSKPHFGFDLDDTLHDFTFSSKQAIDAVYAMKIQKYPNKYSQASLKKSYREILNRYTSSAFKDGRSSFEYRSERFEALLEDHQIPVKQIFIAELLKIYEVTLERNLKLHNGALDLLQELKAQGKTISLVTEGPGDSQRWTVEKLGISPYIDHIFTPGEFGRDKTDGLFQEVLRVLKIEPNELVFVGDNEHRDVHAAKALGILGIWYRTKSNERLSESSSTEELTEGSNVINSLESLTLLLKNHAQS
jgi:putative hydrolase of the HAD superfamily